MDINYDNKRDLDRNSKSELKNLKKEIEDRILELNKRI
jgi:hypothetical protein